MADALTSPSGTPCDLIHASALSLSAFSRSYPLRRSASLTEIFASHTTRSEPITFLAEPVTEMTFGSAFACVYAQAMMPAHAMFATASTTPARRETITLLGSDNDRASERADASVAWVGSDMQASMPVKRNGAGILPARESDGFAIYHA